MTPSKMITLGLVNDFFIESSAIKISSIASQDAQRIIPHNANTLALILVPEPLI